MVSIYGVGNVDIGNELGIGVKFLMLFFILMIFYKYDIIINYI